MANILLRSPYFEYEVNGGASYATMELFVDGTLLYTITKDVNSEGGVLYEIGGLCKDYLDVEYNGTPTSQTVAITGDIHFYDSNDVLLSTVPFSHIGLDGYSEFLEGKNKTIDDGLLLQTNPHIYAPEGEGGFVSEMSSGIINYTLFSESATSVVAGGESILIHRECEPKYTPIKLVFLNKFGSLQNLWFFKKSVKSLKAKRERYKRTIVGVDGSYDTSKHATSVYDSTGGESLVLNSGHVRDYMNEVFKQLTLSEKIWIEQEGNVIPVIITDSELTYQTSVNDKLIEYTRNVEYAFDSINNIR